MQLAFFIKERFQRVTPFCVAGLLIGAAFLLCVPRASNAANEYFSDPKLYYDDQGKLWFEAVWTNAAPVRPRESWSAGYDIEHQFLVVLGADARSTSSYEITFSWGYAYSVERIEFRQGAVLVSTAVSREEAPLLPRPIKIEITGINPSDLAERLTNEELSQFSVMYSVADRERAWYTRILVRVVAADGMFGTTAFFPFQQLKSDASTAILEGDVTVENTVVFRAKPPGPTGNQLKLQVELRKMSEPFTGAFDGGILESNFVVPHATTTITRTGLADGQYKWRARVVDGSGNVVSSWREFGVSGNVDFEIYTPIVQLRQHIDTYASVYSHYGDNWYRLGRGTHVTIRSLTLKGYTSYIYPYTSRVYLQEFNDAHYMSLNQTYVISEDAPFTGEEKEITFEDLNIPLRQDKFYRLDTVQQRQNVNVILKGTGSFGVAMHNDFIYGQGRTEYHYPFYPYLVINKTREPVIIVPGITGSRLNQTGTLGEIEVWPNLASMLPDPLDLWMSLLRLPETGISYPTGNPLFTFPKDIIRKIEAGPFAFDYSQALITHLESLGYREGVDLFAFPYDWRLNVNDITPQLRDKIAFATNNSGTSKVNIIAHSMGGLVAKEYIKQFGGAAVDKLILVGVPNLGAPKAFKALTFGDNLGFQFQIGSSSISLLWPPSVKDVAQNFLAVYQLLPSQSYFIADPANPDFFLYRSYVNDATDVDQNSIRGELNFDQTRQLMLNQGRNSQLFPLADTLHSAIDSWRGADFGVQTFNIVGCESPTLGQFILQNKLFGKKFRPIYIDGDATVPLRSAESVGSDRTLYYKTQSAPQKPEHAQLLTAPGMPELIGEILTAGNPTLPSYVSTQRGDCKLSGFTIADDSPIELHVYDSQGRHVGPLPNGDIEVGIPGAQYDRFEDEKYAFLPPGDTYRLVFQGTQTGTAAISIQPVVNNVITQTISYFDVPVNSASTTAEFNLTPILDDLTLRLDQNGDGTFEAATTPTVILDATASLDFIPPQTTATTSGVLGMNGWFTSDVQVTLTAADDTGGSGILKTEYSLDSGENWQKYETPILISQEGEVTILYHSVDRSGNSENIQTLILKIDKTPPAIHIQPLPSTVILRATATVTFNAEDAVSGLATTSGTFNGNPILTESILTFDQVGQNIVTITAEDIVGNQATENITISVLYDFIGFFPPIKNDGSTTFKLGMTIPVKFQLKDACGQFVPNVAAYIFIAKVRDGIIGTEFMPKSTSAANTGNQFRYDFEQNQYIFNLSSNNLSSGTWQIRTNLGDGTSHAVLILLKQ